MAENLAQFISEYTALKNARYEAYEKLLQNALDSGDEAARGHLPGPGAPRSRGLAWVRIEDGRDTFARFVRERHGDAWKHGTRRRGTHLPSPFDDLGQALAWARAVCETIALADVPVCVESMVIADTGGGQGDR